jgi:nucleoside-diphosphate-sugar epimerase
VKALVTGATGALGPVLVRALLTGGWNVRAAARTWPPDGLPGDVEGLAAEIDDPEAMARAAAGVDAVFHLAALLHVSDPAASLRAEYERVNVRGTDVVLRAALDAGVSRFVFISTIAVYGPTPGRIADESSPTVAESAYAATKLEAERLVLAARAPASGRPAGCVLRMAAVYGRRMKGNYRRLASAMERGRFVPVGDGLNRRTLIHEEDAAAAAVLAATHEAAPGRIYNVTDGGIHTLRDVLDAIGAASGHPPSRAAVPLAWARAGVRIADGLLRVAGRPARFARQLDKYVEDVAVSGARFQRELGFAPRHDLRSGWREALGTAPAPS